uniref:Uncharacterized protein n=1 Tax=Sphaerodactylus townsendi TaxID=933632 RepID=A0ACB8FX06_9SAUR
MLGYEEAWHSPDIPYVGLCKGRAPELRSFPRFMLALWRQFKDPFEEKKVRARLRQIRQGSRSVSEYVLEFRQLAGVVQDWPEQVKIHFFREGLHPEVAQWAMVTTEPTSLAGWYTRAGERGRGPSVQSAATETAEQPPAGFSPSPVGGHLSGSQWQGGRGIS